MYQMDYHGTNYGNQEQRQYRSREEPMAGFVTCGPNEALVVSGCCHRRPLMVPGGRVFVWPVIQKVQRITLNTMTLTIESPRVYTQQGVPISVTGIAQVKIQGQNADMLRAACEQFLGKSEDEIMNVARETLEGHQRAIMASMTVEEIYKNRKKFSKKVFEVASSDLVDMGFTVVSYTIKDISDEEGYLKALGLARTAEVKRDARIGEAEAKRDALIKEALAEEERMAARYINDAEIAKAQRDFELKKAAYDVEVFTKKAESDLSYNLQAAKTKQRIKEEQMQVKVIERTQEIQVQEQEIARKEKELDATVRKPAEAEKYKLEKLAEAHRNKIIMEAEAEAEAIRLRGEAEAFSIEAKAKAEAEQMAKKANAYKEYESAAKVDMVLDCLPKLAAEIAAPLAQCNRVVMISNGDGEVGAGKLTGEVLDIITKVHLTVSQLSGAPLANSPASMLSGMGGSGGKTAKDRTDRTERSFYRDREQYLWSNRTNERSLLKSNHRPTDAQQSPYSKPYHSYRIGDRRSHVGSSLIANRPNPSQTSDNPPKTTPSANITLPSADRQNTSQQLIVKGTPKMSQPVGQPPTRRRISTNGETTKKVDNSSNDPKSGDSTDETNGLDISIGKTNARKSFLRGMSTTEQHDKQKSMLTNMRATTRTRSESTGGDSHPIKISPQKPERARKSFALKTFAMPLPPISGNPEKSQTEKSSEKPFSADESQTSSTPSKRKKRYYKGSTYGLYLSKRKKRREIVKKSKENEPKTVGLVNINLEGEESSQSLVANSESDGELGGESSDVSNDEIEATDDPKQVIEDEEDGDIVEVDFSNDGGVNGDENSQNIEHGTLNQTKPLTLTQESAKKGSQTPSTASSVIDSIRTRRRRKEGEEEPTGHSSASSLISKAESKQSSKVESVPKTSNDSNAKPMIHLPANNVNPSAVQDPNRKTLLRISTAGTVKSGDTHGTYLGIEQSKFVFVKDNTNAQLSQCMCSAKPLIDSSQKDISKGKPLFCQAIDSFDERMIGCCNQVRLTSLFRSSKRVPYRIFCEVHLARLRRHHCCPGCGLFCTQGDFNECFCVKKQIHLFHSKCQIDKPQDPKSQRCLHCGNVSPGRTVRLEMNGPLTNNTYYLQQTSVLKTPKARISVTKKKGKQKMIAFTEECEEPGIEYIIPATKKTLSLAGLPFGPQRKQLEELLLALSQDRQTIRLTIQQNKNFYAVAKNGEVDKVLTILAQGFDPNYEFEDHENETPLHAAASSGHLLVVHLLIQSGAYPNVLNKKMITPLIQAIDNKHNLVVRYLIYSGASIDIRGEDGMTALHFAAKCGNIEAVHYIVNSGKINVNLQDDGGWSALVWATEHKHFNIVKMLVSKGADPSIEDDEENIGLHWAAFSGEVNIALLFLEMDRNVINQTNIHGDTPLHIAARRDNYECVVLLLSRGSDITLMNKNNESPLQCAPKETESEMALRVNQELKRFSVQRQITSEKLLHRDLSKGKEYYQIQVVNGVDNEPYPIDFMYVTENCEASQINIDRTITSLQSCQCEDDCTSQKCVCAAISFRCWYDKEGRLLPEFNLQDAPMIFECNRACSCWKSCNNRVVQWGVRSRLQVFRTNGKGWGVRALRDIPKGSFVCEYIGEIISDSEADRREDDSYLFDLDNKDGETYCLDARFYGNICRFINHLCNPNLTPVKVFVDHQDLSFPRIALFSSRDIMAYEELGFDYGEKFWVIKYKTFTCSCDADNCKYNKDSIHTTIENYYRRLREEQLHRIASPRTDDNPDN